jgi:uncharacterized membrane protein HdeD (DUF308 family)
MLRIGRYTAYFGGIMTFLSLVIGFTAMFNGAEGMAKFFIMLVPIGFLLLFTGVVTTFLVSTDEQKRDQ